MFILSEGCSKSPVLVICHSILGDMLFYTPLLPFINPNNKIVMLTDVPNATVLSFSEIVEQHVEEILRESSNVVIYGHSYGSLLGESIAARLERRTPSRKFGLVISDAATSYTTSDSVGVIDMILQICTKHLNQPLNVYTESFEKDEWLFWTTHGTEIVCLLSKLALVRRECRVTDLFSFLAGLKKRIGFASIFKVEPYTGRLVLLSTLSEKNHQNINWELSGAKIVKVNLPCDHFTIMDSPSLEIVADILNNELKSLGEFSR